MANYSMEIPSIMETQLTGYYGAAIAEFRGSIYRSEVRTSGFVHTKNGSLASWAELPRPVQVNVNAFVKGTNQMIERGSYAPA